ncbi:MAG: MFS transporter [Anaerolineaceae bacterium]|nr:MFS transporter [Anaerolineaceae bacterium]
MMQSKPLRYTMFGLLYFTQGTILSYFTALNALYLLSRGLTMTNVGIFSAIALVPFVIKIFLGMLSDRVNILGLGYRKPYILLGLAIQTLCLLIVPAIDPGSQYWLFVTLAFVLQLGMALYDTCTDGLALDTATEGERGTIQAFMVGGRAVGVIVTASVVGLLAQNVSWPAVFYLLAALTLLPLPFVLSIKEVERPAGRRFEWGAFSAFKRADVLAVSGVGLIAFLVIVGANQLVNPFLTERFGINLSTAGFFTTLWGIGVVAGGVLGGRLNDRAGGKRAILVSGGLSSLSLVLLALTGQILWAWPAVFFFGFAYGAYQASYFALAMRFTDPRIAAAMFSIIMAFTNVGQAIGLGLGGTIVDAIGYTWTLIGFAAVNLLVLPLLPAVFRRKP